MTVDSICPDHPMDGPPRSRSSATRGPEVLMWLQRISRAGDIIYLRHPTRGVPGCKQKLSVTLADEGSGIRSTAQ